MVLFMVSYWCNINSLLVGTFVYVLGGCIYKRKKLGLSGNEACPNYDFWKQIPVYVKVCYQYPQLSNDMWLCLITWWHGIIGWFPFRVCQQMQAWWHIQPALNTCVHLSLH
jgi:hypothetical protein